jgi:hypothetical protein
MKGRGGLTRPLREGAMCLADGELGIAGGEIVRGAQDRRIGTVDETDLSDRVSE